MGKFKHYQCADWKATRLRITDRKIKVNHVMNIYWFGIRSDKKFNF